MARFLQGAPFQLGAVALAAALLAAAFVLAPRKARRSPVPGLPGDGDPLECWEWDRFDLIEEHYADDAAEPDREGTP